MSGPLTTAGLLEQATRRMDEEPGSSLFRLPLPMRMASVRILLGSADPLTAFRQKFRHTAC